MADLIKLRNDMKRKKPTFKAQKQDKKKQLKKRYRKPKGSDSKMRLNQKNRLKTISKGYKSPLAVKGKHRSGLTITRIATEKQLENLKDTGIIVSKTVGLKKKLAIMKKAMQQNLKILNLNAEKYIQEKEKSRLKTKKTKVKPVEKVEKKTETIEDKVLKSSQPVDKTPKPEGKKE